MRPYPLTADELVDDVLAELDRVTDEVRRTFGPLTDEQLAWRPAPRKWGVGHCLVHLARINQLYREALAAALRGGRDAAGPPPPALRGRWFGRLFTRQMGPGGFRVKTPALTRPRQEAASSGSLEAFFAEQIRLRAVVDGARGAHLDAIRVVSPLSSRVKLAVGDAFRLLAAHEARHLEQARRVLADPGFPR